MQRGLIVALCIAGTSHAQTLALCSSDGTRPAAALFERFINADCATCWTAPDTPAAPNGALPLDWVLAGTQGDAAPLAVVALREAADRQEMRAGSAPRPESLLSPVEQSTGQLRVAHGLVLGGYVGASLTFHCTRGMAEPLTGWLALIEHLPSGTEGSPVPRQLVRNVIVQPIAAQAPNDGVKAQIWRPMNVPEGAKPERLAVAGWVTDTRGRVLAVTQSRCAPAAAPPKPARRPRTP